MDVAAADRAVGVAGRRRFLIVARVARLVDEAAALLPRRGRRPAAEEEEAEEEVEEEAEEEVEEEEEEVEEEVEEVEEEDGEALPCRSYTAGSADRAGGARAAVALLGGVRASSCGASNSPSLWPIICSMRW